MGHSSVFVETCDAHTLLGTVTQTNLQLVWKEGCGESVSVENQKAHTLLRTVTRLFTNVHLYWRGSLTLVFLSILVEHTLCLEQ